MTPGQRILAACYYGAPRRLFRPVALRTIGRAHRIASGPLAGARFTGQLTQLLGIYELAAQEVVLATLGTGDVFYDVGASTGYFTLLASRRVAPKGAVIALEPLPANLDHLTRLVLENQVRNCEIVAAAASDSAGTAELFVDASLATPSLVASSRLDRIEVRTARLDDIARQHPRPTLVKVDVEGAEDQVLAGAEELLSAPAAPDWLIETHSPACERCVRDRLSRGQYAVVTLAERRQHDRPYPQHLFATRSASAAAASVAAAGASQRV